MLTPGFKLSTLRALDLFAPLDDDELELLRPALAVRSCPIGEIVMEQGTDGDEMYVLLVGEVKVVSDRGCPSEHVLATLKPVDIFGEMALFTHEKRSASVVATDTCRFLTLTRAGLEQILLEHPSVCLTLLQEAYRRIYRLDDTLRRWAGSTEQD